MDKKIGAIIALTVLGVLIFGIIGYFALLSVASSLSGLVPARATATPAPPSLLDPNTTAVPIFTADFGNHLNQWIPIKGKWVTIEDGQTRYQSVSTDSSKNIVITGVSTWSNYEAEATIKPTVHLGNGDFGLLVRYQDSDNYYFAGYSSDCDYTLTNCKNYWRIWRTSSGSDKDLDKEETAPVEIGKDYSLRVIANGTNLQLYVNDQLQASGEDKATFVTDPYTTGKVGLYAFNGTVSFDNVSVLGPQVHTTATTPPGLIAQATITTASPVAVIAPNTDPPPATTQSNVNPYFLPLIVNPFTLGIAIMAIIMGVIVYFVFGRGGMKAGTSHGSAHFATAGELRQSKHIVSPGALRRERQAAIKTNTSPPTRFIVGKANGKLIFLGDYQIDQHILINATTGKGKTSLLIVPNMLIERGNRSIFAIDPKSELYDICAGALSQKMEIWRFNPTPEGEATSHYYNPLAHIRTMSEARDFALCWIYNSSPSGSGGSSEPFWDRAAEAMITGVVLYLIDTEEEPPLSRLATVFCKLSFGRIRDLILEGPSEAARDVTGALFANLEKNDRLAGSIMTELATRFFVLQDPVIKRVTEHNDLDFTRMTTDPIALFLSIPSHDARKLRMLSSCLIMQMITAWIRKGDSSPGKRLPRSITCYLDEFANVGKIPDMETHITTLRSRGVAIIMAIQNQKQLKDTYGDDTADTIIGNATTHLVLCGGEQRDCQYYSDRLGKTTIVVHSQSESTSNLTNGSSSQSQSLTSRLLMMPDEIRTMRIGQVLMIASNLQPVIAQATPYYEDKDLKQLANLPYSVQVIRTKITSDKPIPKRLLELAPGIKTKPGQVETIYTTDIITTEPTDRQTPRSDDDDEEDIFAP